MHGSVVRPARPSAALAPVIRGVLLLSVTTLVLSASTASLAAQMGGLETTAPAARGATPMPHDRPFYREGTFHALLGAVLIAGAFLAYRGVRNRPRRRAGPAAFVSEAVLAVDLVDSTRLATHYGEATALHARNALTDRMRRLTETARTFLETTGDGCLATFPAVPPALDAGMALLRELPGPPDRLPSGPPLEVRVGLTYGELLLDARGVRHGSAINKAYRLLGVKPADLVALKADADGTVLPERTRILLDEDAAQEAPRSAGLRFVGYARLRGFTGLHGLHEVAGPPAPSIASVAPPTSAGLASGDPGGVP
jgi:class 3 adenylate cyclase